MKTKLINLALLVAIAVAIAVAVFRWLPSIQKKDAASAGGYVLSIDQSEVNRVHFYEREQGIDFTAAGTLSSIGKTQYTVENGEPFVYSHEKLYSVIAKLCSMKYTRLVGRYDGGPSAEELERYGLSQPTAQITMFCDSGDYVLTFGSSSGLNDGWYLLFDDSIYVVAPSVYQLCLKPTSFFRQLEVFPDTGKTLETLARFTFYDADGALKYEIKKAEGAATADGAPSFAMAAPVEADVVSNAFYTNVVSPVYSFVMTEYVEDFPKDLSQYGLDRPYKVSIAAVDGASATLLFAPAQEDGLFYGMREGVPSVFLFYGEADFLKVQYYELLNRAIFSVGADSTRTIEVASASSTVKIECRPSPRMNGEPLGAAKFDEILRALNQMQYTGDVLTAEAAQPDYTVTVTDSANVKNTFAFYMVDSREYAVRCNGVFTYQTNASYINQMRDAFNLPIRENAKN